MDNFTENNPKENTTTSSVMKSRREVFSEIMKELYSGTIKITPLNKKISADPETSTQIKKELLDILKDYEEYVEDDEDDDNNDYIKRQKYTREFNNKHGKILKKLGITIDDKYIIDANGGGEYSINPNIYIRDVTLFTEVLKEFPKNISAETLDSLGIILESTERLLTNILLEDNNFMNNEYAINFFIECKRLNNECKRLGLWKKVRDPSLLDHIIAWESKGVEKYISFLSLGFCGNLQNPKNNDIPAFIGYIISKGEKRYKGDKNIDIEIDQIKKSISLLKDVLTNKALFFPLSNELKNGLEQALEMYTNKGINEEFEKDLIEYLEIVNEMIDLAEEIKKDNQ